MLMFTVGNFCWCSVPVRAAVQDRLNRAWRQVHAAEAPVASDWLTDAMPASGGNIQI